MQENMAVDVTEPEDCAVAEEMPTNGPSYPQRMEEIDMLRIQNLNLKMSNNQLRHQAILNEVAAAKREQIDLVAQMTQVRQDALTKYGVDLATHQINPDGTFSTKPGPGM